jgi:hypothetical protein
MRKVILLASAALTLSIPAAAPASSGHFERCGRQKPMMMVFLPCWLVGIGYKD